MDIVAALKPYQTVLNQELHRLVDRFLPGPPDLDLMLRYHLGWVDEHGHSADFYPGKQIRPLLLLLCAEIAGGDWHQAVPAAAAVELLHNFSLIHDDIEDGSALRRGRPTLWKIWGVPMAINAGDTLFVIAHAVLEALVDSGVSARCFFDVFRIFEGVNLGLTRGQHMDMSFEHRADVPVAEYLDMIAGKSALLIAGSAELGAVIAGLSAPEAARYRGFGHSLGMAFQIRDDVLGIWGDPADTGKSVATDLLSRKKSLPVLCGMERSPEFREYYRRSPGEGEDLSFALRCLESVGAREFSVSYEERYAQEASLALALMPECGARDVLGGVVSMLLGRRS